MINLSQANRRMASEEVVTNALALYQSQGVGVIKKVETPKKILSNGTSFFSEKSIVDYIGVARGKPVAFDVKSTRIKTRFPLENVHVHQYEFLRDFQECGGISFLLIQFILLDEWYVLPFGLLDEYWKAKEKGGRKSIPYQTFKEKAPQIRQGGRTGLDFLSFLFS